jgi:hypothetical protein
MECSITANGKALLSGFEFENIKLEQMNNKELLIDFIEYAKSRHVMPILHSNIEPLVDDYLHQQNLQQCNVSGALPHPCVDPLFEIKGCDMPKGSCSACCGNDR